MNSRDGCLTSSGKGFSKIKVQFKSITCSIVYYEIYRDSGFTDFSNLEHFLASKSNNHSIRKRQYACEAVQPGLQ